MTARSRRRPIRRKTDNRQVRIATVRKFSSFEAADGGGKTSDLEPQPGTTNQHDCAN
jgi:hypothetical protein